MFPESQVTTAGPVVGLVPKCGACGLFKVPGICSPKMPVSGKGRKGIMIIGEAPGANEDEQGEAFVGNSGKDLQSVLGQWDVDLERDCWRTNALICRPFTRTKKGKLNNRKPTKKEIAYCRPNVVNAIKKHKPHLIIVLGAVPILSVMPYAWQSKEAVGGVMRWRGWTIPCQTTGAWVCPTFHPAYVLRQDEKNDLVTRMFYERDLENAIACLGKDTPRKLYPQREITTVYDSHGAAALIHKMIDRGGPIALDYETNMLKPDSDWAEIVCGAVSNGGETIAFPWNPKTTGKAVSRLITSKNVRLIGANLQFEERWNIKKLGHGATNWRWDTVVNSHLIDNRKAPVNSVKFQAYVQFGQPTYNEWIDPYLKSKRPNDQNNIHQIAMKDLLIYCGTDALLEFMIALRQSQILGIPI